MSTNFQTSEFKTPSEYKKWLVAGMITLALVIFCAGYVAFIGVELFSLQALSFVSAAVASFLFALAFVASSVSYYTGWPNMRWGYQKQIGVLAFLIASLYCVTFKPFEGVFV